MCVKLCGTSITIKLFYNEMIFLILFWQLYSLRGGFEVWTLDIYIKIYIYIYWNKHNNNENTTMRNWIIFLNIINVKKEITQHYLDWGIAFALFKEIQVLSWLNFIIGADLFWLVSPRYNNPTNVVWLKQHLHKVFKPKIPPERTPFLAKKLHFFSVFLQ